MSILNKFNTILSESEFVFIKFVFDKTKFIKIVVITYTKIKLIRYFQLIFMFKILRTKKVNIQNIVLKIFNLDSKFINIIIIKINKTKLFKVLFFFQEYLQKKI